MTSQFTTGMGWISPALIALAYMGLNSLIDQPNRRHFNALMVAGLIRIGEAANRVMDGSAHRALAHATSGPCLQQNLVCSLADNPGGA